MPKNCTKRKRRSYYSPATRRRCPKKKKHKISKRSQTKLKVNRRANNKSEATAKKVPVPQYGQETLPRKSSSRDLSNKYDIEPRWPASKRCANWVKSLPRRTYWSTGTTQSTKSNESFETMTICNKNEMLSDSDTKTMQQENHSFATSEFAKHRSYLTKEPSSTSSQKYSVEKRSSYQTLDDIRFPPVSAKRRSESAREACLRGHEITNQLYRKMANEEMRNNNEKLKQALEKSKLNLKRVDRRQQSNQFSATKTNQSLARQNQTNQFMATKIKQPINGQTQSNQFSARKWASTPVSCKTNLISKQNTPGATKGKN